LKLPGWHLLQLFSPHACEGNLIATKRKATPVSIATGAKLKTSGKVSSSIKTDAAMHGISLGFSTVDGSIKHMLQHLKFPFDRAIRGPDFPPRN